MCCCRTSSVRVTMCDVIFDFHFYISDLVPSVKTFRNRTTLNISLQNSPVQSSALHVSAREYQLQILQFCLWSLRIDHPVVCCRCFVLFLCLFFGPCFCLFVFVVHFAIGCHAILHFLLMSLSVEKRFLYIL